MVIAAAQGERLWSVNPGALRCLRQLGLRPCRTACCIGSLVAPSNVTLLMTATVLQ
jgi:hypothetical protein